MERKNITCPAWQVIAAIWVVSFLIGLGIPCFLLARHAIESDVFSAAIDEVSGIYAPHVGTILAYWSVSSG